MKKIVGLILTGLFLSAPVWAEKKPQNNKKGVVMTTDNKVNLADSIKVSKRDSLRTVADTYLAKLQSEPDIVTPQLDRFLLWLIEVDTLSAQEALLKEFGEEIIEDIRTLKIRDDSVRRRYVEYHSLLNLFSQIQKTLSNTYDPNSLALAEQHIKAIDKTSLTEYRTRQIERMKKGVKYYKNKMVLRRLGDIINELYALKSDSIVNRTDSIQYDVRDSIFNEIINHEGRNNLIGYVPYAESLRQKVLKAVPYDSLNHVQIMDAQWGVIDAVKQEITSVLLRK